MILDKVTSRLLDLKAELGVDLLLVGVEGKGCSGKSRLALKLRERVQERGTAAQAVSIDDFCNPRAVRYCSHVEEGLQIYQHNFDEEKWERAILGPARNHGRLIFDQVLLDPGTDAYDHRVVVNLPHGGILIAEGIHVLKKRFRHYFHYKIFVHISDAEQLRRAHLRDVAVRRKTLAEIDRKYRERMVPSYAYFLATDSPLGSVDMILDNKDPNCPREMDVEEARRSCDV